MSDGVVTMKELRDLLSGFASAAPNTGPAPDILIYDKIHYLMPLKEAVKVLGLSQVVNSTITVSCPGMPYHSLFGVSFKGKFENGFDGVVLVTDSAKQVVAVEFTNVSTKKITLDRLSTKKEWVTFDFVNTRTKGQDAAMVRHGTETYGKVLRIDSVFVNPDSDKRGFRGYGGYSGFEGGTEMHPTRLYLPRPLAELILYRISKSLPHQPAAQKTSNMEPQ
ncbi:MAG: hypothetical protein DVB28_001927 [Verrucomicrobia bacterium]|nr:MAG: hypothetical protein DVB28_001927 [Verrucomicrobiota bacterium]